MTSPTQVDRPTKASERTEGLIRILPDSLANKIAAGEVVQRPASVVKELVENALDAGAENVTVVVKKSGRDLVQVIDDGCGMSTLDAQQAFLRHSTSKISSIDDLLRIRTLGFRGEALASIASVAQVELRSRRHEDEVGTCVTVHGSEMLSVEPCSAEPGTIVSVRNLFFNVPARRSFLKSNATEFKHIVDTFQSLALSHPEVGFRLIHESQELHGLPPTRGQTFEDRLRLRIRQLFGDRFEGNLVSVNEDTSYISLSGVVAKPEFSRRTRGEQFFFVNKRFVKNGMLDHAVSNAFGEMLPKGSYPFFALFMALDPEHVDVNVHPTKAEVKFDDDRGMYGFVLAVTRKALGESDIRPSAGFDARGRLYEQGSGMPSGRGTPNETARTPPGWDRDLSGAWPMGSHRADSGQSQIFRTRGDEAASILYDMGTRSDPVKHAVTIEASTEKTGDSVGDARIWQLHEKYILARIRSGLMIVDQHAAHERILYERALAAIQDGLGMTQQLLFPQVVEFEAGDFELVKDLLPDLRGLGFDVETMSGRSVIIRGVPADIRVGDERTILDEVIQQFKTFRDTLKLSGRDNLAASLACKTAIKTGQKLGISEMQSLIDQLFMCQMPYACPHGRPTMVKISLEELDRRFGRVGHLERN